jgi:hypothetical protein
LFDLLITANKIKSNEIYDNTPNGIFHSQNRNTKDVSPQPTYKVLRVQLWAKLMNLYVDGIGNTLGTR